MAVVAALFAATAIWALVASNETVAGGAPSVSATSTATPSVFQRTKEAVPSPPSIAQASRLARSVPVRLQIEAIGVDTTLMALGLRKDGTMEVPPSGFPAGWYTGAPTPGELGPAIVAGHIDWNGPGVFYRLADLLPGDQITITRKDGSKPVFRVTRVAQFAKDHFPTKLVYGNLDHAGLRLITCGGSFNNVSGHYEDNIIVFADLIAPAR